MSNETGCTDFCDNYNKFNGDIKAAMYEKAILECVKEMQESGSVRVFGSDLATIGFFVNRYKGDK